MSERNVILVMRQQYEYKKMKKVSYSTLKGPKDNFFITKWLDCVLIALV